MLYNWLQVSARMSKEWFKSYELHRQSVKILPDKVLRSSPSPENFSYKKKFSEISIIKSHFGWFSVHFRSTLDAYPVHCFKQSAWVLLKTYKSEICRDDCREQVYTCIDSCPCYKNCPNGCSDDCLSSICTCSILRHVFILKFTG